MALMALSDAKIAQINAAHVPSWSISPPPRQAAAHQLTVRIARQRSWCARTNALCVCLLSSDNLGIRAAAAGAVASGSFSRHFDRYDAAVAVDDVGIEPHSSSPSSRSITSLR